jgi:hypothetical protein
MGGAQAGNLGQAAKLKKIMDHADAKRLAAETKQANPTPLASELGRTLSDPQVKAAMKRADKGLVLMHEEFPATIDIPGHGIGLGWAGERDAPATRTKTWVVGTDGLRFNDRTKAHRYTTSEERTLSLHPSDVALEKVLTADGVRQTREKFLERYGENAWQKITADLKDASLNSDLLKTLKKLGGKHITLASRVRGNGRVEELVLSAEGLRIFTPERNSFQRVYEGLHLNPFGRRLKPQEWLAALEPGEVQSKINEWIEAQPTH